MRRSAVNEESRRRYTQAKAQLPAKNEKPCGRCGTPFTPRSPAHRFCSRRCQKRKYFEANYDPARSRKHQRNWRERYPERYKAKRQRDDEQARERRRHLTDADRRLINAAGFRLRHGARKEALLPPLLSLQKGTCYLCGDELDPGIIRAVHVDHDHSCREHSPYKTCEICRRGLACKRCNLLIGIAGDDPVLLRRIADNLEVANASVRQRREGTLF